MKINTNKWKKFKFTDIFIIKKGYYNKKSEVSTGIDIPFLGATNSNNGVISYYSLDDIKLTSMTKNYTNEDINKKIFLSNAVCVTNNGSVGFAYYQPKPFTCSCDVTPLYRIDGEFNQYTGLFIATIIMKDKYRWGYGRKWKFERMIKSDIFLPITENGTPDWEWMEIYIKTLCSPIKTKNTKIKCNMNITSWKNFYLHKLFNTRMGNGIDAVLTTTDNPKYNYVSRDSNGNGVVAFVDEIEGQEPFPVGTMTLALGGSFLGSCFVQKKPFYTAQNVGILQEKEPMSIYSKLFIATLVRNECKIKYQAFGRELNTHFRKDFTIKLPVKIEQSKIVYDEDKIYSDEGYIPDWEWIDNFVKKLPYSDKF